MAREQSSSPMPVDWELVHDTGTGHTWTWHRLRKDGSIELTSSRLPDFGAAVDDALKHGFNPNDQHWVVRSKSLMTRFPPGEKAVCMTPGGQALVRAVDRRSAPTAAMRERTSKPAAAQEFERSKKAVRVPR